MAEVDTTTPDWPLVLAQNFLDAARSCGFECDRVFVAAGQLVESPPPGCPCQLAVLVTPGVAPERDPRPQCRVVRTATVTLVLDLCYPVPGDGEVLSPEVSSQAGAEQTLALEQIMRGLLTGSASGALVGGPMPWASGNIGHDTWTAVSAEGGMARWQTRWTFRDT